MKRGLQIYRTNWITILGIFIAVYIASITISVLNNQLGIGEAIFGSLFGLLTYGMIFWIGFLIALLVLDILLIGSTDIKLDIKLILEWAILSTPFIYWFVSYTEEVFLVAVIAFLITQFIRRNKITEILS